MKNIKLLNEQGQNCSLSNIFGKNATIFIINVETNNKSIYTDLVKEFIKAYYKTQLIKSDEKITIFQISDSLNNKDYLIIEE